MRVERVVLIWNGYPGRLRMYMCLVVKYSDSFSVIIINHLLQINTNV